MVERKWLGDKTKQGFYKKSRSASGEEERLALDLNTIEYRPFAKAKIPSLGDGQERRQPSRALAHGAGQ